INNAAVFIPNLATEFNHEDYNTMMGINFEASYHLSQLAHPFLKASGNGRIVSISSVAGLLSLPLCSTYSAAKGRAMNQLTRSLACEWVKDNIRVNAVAPCVIKTSLIEAASQDPEVKEIINKLVSRTPIGGRPGEPKEVSAMFGVTATMGWDSKNSLLADGSGLKGLRCGTGLNCSPPALGHAALLKVWADG
ncbi:Tropinone reductase 2, partial [Capsicum chinense]